MNKIRVENYRAIEDSGMIEICPITIAVGRNSAGKSSFIRLFPLLKQTLEKKTSDPILWYGDYVDFGDFQHTVSKSNKENPIKISFEIDGEYSGFRHFYVEKNMLQKYNITLSIRKNVLENVIIEFKDQIIEIIIDNKRNTIIKINGDSTVFGDKNILAVNSAGDIIPMLFQQVSIKKEEGYTRLSSKEILEKCNKYIFDNSRRERRYISYRDFLDVELGSREEILHQLKIINKTKFEKKEVTHKRFLKYNNYIIAVYLPELLDKINQTIQNEMRQTNYIKPIRAMVNRYYRVQGVSISELDADGSNLPMILHNLNKGKLLEFEKWSKDKFGIIFSVDSTEGHISLVIKNKINGKDKTNVADTGYGYSQMLPIVMLLWMIHENKGRNLYKRRRTLVIEQPELHLHPAYQAKMMDVFVNIVKEAKANQINLRIIFETHSETMINRLGTLVAYGKISKDDINILVFDKNNSTTNIKSKKFDDDGLLRGWPCDFFAPEDIE